MSVISAFQVWASAHSGALGERVFQPRLHSRFHSPDSRPPETPHRFEIPLQERAAVVALDAIIMAVSIGGLAFTLFVAYSVFR